MKKTLKKTEKAVEFKSNIISIMEGRDIDR